MSGFQLSYRLILPCLLSTTAFADGSPDPRPSGRGRIVATRTVITQTDPKSLPDLAAFNGRLYLTFLDTEDNDTVETCIRVMSSGDGASWTSQNPIRQVEPDRELLSPEQAVKRGRYGSPRFSVENGRRLSVYAADAAAEQDGDRRISKWSSTDGMKWEYAGRTDLGAYFGRPAWDKDAGYCYEFGRGCGSASTIRIWRTTDGRDFAKHYTHTFRDMPRDASLFFANGNAYCLLARCGFSARYRLVDGVPELVEQSPTGKSTFEPAILGTSTFPYLDWEWTELGTTIFSPNVIHVPRMGTFAAVEIRTNPSRTALCKLDLETGRLDEVVRLGDLRPGQMGPTARLPEAETYMPIGLAAHQGHIWISYAEENAIKVVQVAVN